MRPKVAVGILNSVDPKLTILDASNLEQYILGSNVDPDQTAPLGAD